MLQGTNCVLVNEVKVKTTDLLNRLTENVLCYCFEQKQHHMQLHLNSETDYSEGDPK